MVGKRVEDIYTGYVGTVLKEYIKAGVKWCDVKNEVPYIRVYARSIPYDNLRIVDDKDRVITEISSDDYEGF